MQCHSELGTAQHVDTVQRLCESDLIMTWNAKNLALAGPDPSHSTQPSSWNDPLFAFDAPFWGQHGSEPAPAKAGDDIEVADFYSHQSVHPT